MVRSGVVILSAPLDDETGERIYSVHTVSNIGEYLDSEGNPVKEKIGHLLSLTVQMCRFLSQATDIAKEQFQYFEDHSIPHTKTPLVIELNLTTGEYKQAAHLQKIVETEQPTQVL